MQVTSSDKESYINSFLN